MVWTVFVRAAEAGENDGDLSLMLTALHSLAEQTCMVCMRRAAVVAAYAPGPSTSCRKKVRKGRETTCRSRSMPLRAGSCRIGAVFAGALGEKRNHAAS
jgi:hypothetical protein